MTEQVTGPVLWTVVAAIIIILIIIMTAIISPYFGQLISTIFGG